MYSNRIIRCLEEEEEGVGVGKVVVKKLAV